MEETELSAESITLDLDTRFIGQRVIYFPAVDSTMDAARRESRWGAEAGTVIIAEEQTAARGRLNRKWISPRGELAFSLILRPNRDYLPNIIMLASLAVVLSIESVTGLQAGIKWPNDVLINNQKVCGILIENEIYKNNLIYSIVGIGVNVNLRVSDYPEIASTATSLSDQLGQNVSRLDLLRSLLVHMERLYFSLSSKDEVYHGWAARMVTLGQNVQVTQGKITHHGVAESVSRDGSLNLREENGNLVRILAGDITQRKGG